MAVGNCGMCGKYFRTLCQIPTVKTDRIYPSVILEWVVIFLQLSVKYRRNGFVCKAVGVYLKYF
jgi:hypothetical protein